MEFVSRNEKRASMFGKWQHTYTIISCGCVDINCCFTVWLSNLLDSIYRHRNRGMERIDRSPTFIPALLVLLFLGDYPPRAKKLFRLAAARHNYPSHWRTWVGVCVCVRASVRACVCVRFLRGSVADTTGSRRTLLTKNISHGRSQFKVHTDERTQVHVQRSAFDPWRSPIQVLTETDVT
jgi:hypothetical protein